MAVTMTGNITVTIDNGGNLYGNTYTGNFSFDNSNLTGVGTEYLLLPGATPIANGYPGLLSVNFTFLDIATGLGTRLYTANDDYNFPDDPLLKFNNGNLVGLSFGAADNSTSNLFSMSSDGLFQYDLTIPNADAGIGGVVYSLTPVPFEFSPATGLLSMGAVWAAGFWWRQQKRKS